MSAWVLNTPAEECAAAHLNGRCEAQDLIIAHGVHHDSNCCCDAPAAACAAALVNTAVHAAACRYMQVKAQLSELGYASHVDALV